MIITRTGSRVAGKDVIRYCDLLPSHSFPAGGPPDATGESSRVQLESSPGEFTINASRKQQDPRLEELRQWLGRIDGFDGAEINPASVDASFRRYFRVRASGVSRVVMDAPPALEDSRPFVRIAGYLEQIGLNSPRILQADLEKGFLLLTDLGSAQYLEQLRLRPELAGSLYADALAALSKLQEKGRRFQSGLPPYDSKLLRFELSLFRDWLCGRHLGLEFAASDEADWQASVELLVDNALRQPRVFVHRDYHSRNLMVTADNNPGILDFQDAVEGPMTYDLVSLLKDCYIRWPVDKVRRWAMDFHAASPVAGTADEFMRSFELMGVQRHLKAAGIFVRLSIRDGKQGYLKDIPRTLGYISELGLRYPELEFLARLIDERCLPLLRRELHSEVTSG
jgi:N-acetylmuramate 1-kinase